MILKTRVGNAPFGELDELALVGIGGGGSGVVDHPRGGTAEVSVEAGLAGQVFTCVSETTHGTGNQLVGQQGLPVSGRPEQDQQLPLIQTVFESRQIKAAEPCEEVGQRFPTVVVLCEEVRQELVEPRPVCGVSVRGWFHRNGLAVVQDLPAVEVDNTFATEHDWCHFVNAAVVAHVEHGLLDFGKRLPLLRLRAETHTLEFKHQLVLGDSHRPAVEELVVAPAAEPVLVNQRAKLRLLILLDELLAQDLPPRDEAFTGTIRVADHSVLAHLAPFTINAVVDPEERATGTHCEFTVPPSGEPFGDLKRDFVNRDVRVLRAQRAIVARLQKHGMRVRYRKPVPDALPVGPKLEGLAWLEAGAVEARQKA